MALIAVEISRSSKVNRDGQNTQPVLKLKFSAGLGVIKKLWSNGD